VTEVRFKLDDYSIRVLDIVKGKFGLKNRNEALIKFIEEFGGKYLDKDVSDEVIVHFNNVLREHYEKYEGKKNKLSLDEVDKILGLK
jgi:hypothetical protein